jgi:hypothetical protein
MSENSKRRRFEYLTVDPNKIAGSKPGGELERLGQEGWEAVGMISTAVFLFKREIGEQDLPDSRPERGASFGTDAD